MPKVLKMKVIDAAKASKEMGTLSGKETVIDLGVIPENMRIMQVTPDGKVFLFYEEVEPGAIG